MAATLTATSFRRLATGLRQPARKAFRRGTHRCLSPAETLVRFRGLAAAMGITRIGNVTGLDHIGIPVAIAVRPNSRSISVSQGKGLDLPQAMASALMEAAEGFHAEDIAARYHFASYQKLAAGPIATADPASLGAAAYDAVTVIPWIEGHDLLRDEPCWVPAELVHTDFTLPSHPGCGHFAASSNGLGSGNHRLEALSAAICELVERDAVALWKAAGLRQRAGRHLDPASVRDGDCRALLERYAQAGVAVRLRDVTSDVGIATFLCDISAPSEDVPDALRRFRGAGCHPDPAIALARALTEAAQCRLTYITGIRDDLPAAEYAPSPDGEIEEALLDVLQQASAPISFDAASCFLSDDLGEDVRWELDRLAAIGITRVIAVDLTRPDLALPVVRVVIPGLEGFSSHPQYLPGPRALSAART